MRYYYHYPFLEKETEASLPKGGKNQKAKTKTNKYDYLSFKIQYVWLQTLCSLTIIPETIEMAFVRQNNVFLKKSFKKLIHF